MKGSLTLSEKGFVVFVWENGKKLVLKLRPGANYKRMRDSIVAMLKRVGTVPAILTNENTPKVAMAGQAAYPFTIAGFDKSKDAARGRLLGVTDGFVNQYIEKAGQCKTQTEFEALRKSTIEWLYPAKSTDAHPHEKQPFNEHALWNIMNTPQRALMIQFKKDVLCKLPR